MGGGGSNNKKSLTLYVYNNPYKGVLKFPIEHLSTHPLEYMCASRMCGYVTSDASLGRRCFLMISGLSVDKSVNFVAKTSAVSSSSELEFISDRNTFSSNMEESLSSGELVFFDDDPSRLLIIRSPRGEKDLFALERNWGSRPFEFPVTSGLLHVTSFGVFEYVSFMTSGRDCTCLISLLKLRGRLCNFTTHLPDGVTCPSTWYGGGAKHGFL